MKIVSNVVSWLKAGGISANRAYPGGQLQVPTSPVAAVQIEKLDHTAGEAVVLVNVIASVRSGGAACEATAMQVNNILCKKGGSCTVEKCRVLAGAELLCVPVRVRFSGREISGSWTAPASFTLTMGGVVREHVVSFTAERVLDDDEAMLIEMPWSFTLEEFFPLDATEESEALEPFAIIVNRQDGQESYTECKLTRQKRIFTNEGVRHIREGIAVSEIDA